MTDLAIRIYLRGKDGDLSDGDQDYEVSDFGGILPSIGDSILYPGVLANGDRRKPENREVWTVVGRMFNPRDLPNYIGLIVGNCSPLLKNPA